jgi:hypothetical protein
MSAFLSRSISLFALEQPIRSDSEKHNMPPPIAQAFPSKLFCIVTMFSRDPVYASVADLRGNGLCPSATPTASIKPASGYAAESQGFLKNWHFGAIRDGLSVRIVSIETILLVVGE